MAAHHEVEQQLLQLPLLTGTAIGAEERDLLVGRRARALRRRGRAACRALALGTAAAMRAVSAERLAHRLEDGHWLILALDLNGGEHIPAAAAARRGVARLVGLLVAQHDAALLLTSKLAARLERGGGGGRWRGVEGDGGGWRGVEGGGERWREMEGGGGRGGASLLLACISRAARLTLAPASVYSTRLRTQPASPQKTSPVVMPTATCRLPLEPSSSPSSVQAGMASSAATTSRLESTARSSSWSCWWPGRPKAMRKRVPLSSVMRRVMAPSYRCTAFWMARVACCTTSRLSTSHGFGPSPSTWMENEMDTAIASIAIVSIAMARLAIASIAIASIAVACIAIAPS